MSENKNSSESNSVYKLKLREPTLHIDEDKLRKAGVRAYFIEIKAITKDKSEIIFTKQNNLRPPPNGKS